MNKNTISAFTLERYNLDELSPKDKRMVEDALAMDSNLRFSLEKLDKSDRELRLLYPASFLWNHINDITIMNNLES